MLSNQNLAQSQEFSFDEYSLAAVSSSLRSLDLRNDHIVDPSSLYFLEWVRSVDLRGNRVEQVDAVAPFLATTPALSSLDLGGNPITKLHKYREQLIVLTTGLKTLDGKKIM